MGTLTHTHTLTHSHTHTTHTYVQTPLERVKTRFRTHTWLWLEVVLEVVGDVVVGVGEGVCIGDGGRERGEESDNGRAPGQQASRRGEGEAASETAVVGVGRRLSWCERMSGSGYRRAEAQISQRALPLPGAGPAVARDDEGGSADHKQKCNQKRNKIVAHGTKNNNE